MHLCLLVARFKRNIFMTTGINGQKPPNNYSLLLCGIPHNIHHTHKKKNRMSFCFGESTQLKLVDSLTFQ